MHQYLFHIGDFPIRMYGLVLCMSIFLATGVAYFLANRMAAGSSISWTLVFTAALPV